MTNVIITGGTGFLGYALLLNLVKNGCAVTVLHSKDSKRFYRLNGILKMLPVACDLLKADEVVLNDKYDVFYHLAWGGARDNFDEQHKNIEMTVKCLKLAKQSGCKRFVCTGSQAEYGEVSKNIVITEETALNPVTSYGACKAAAYYLTKDLAGKLSLEYTWVRPFSVYGQHDNPNSLVPQLLDAIYKKREYSLSTNGLHIWNYLHEDDAAEALRLLGICDVSNTVFNLAGDDNLPLKEFVEVIQQVVNPLSTVTFGNKNSGINMNVSNRKIKTATGWKPVVPFNKENLRW